MKLDLTETVGPPICGILSYSRTICPRYLWSTIKRSGILVVVLHGIGVGFHIVDTSVPAFSTQESLVQCFPLHQHDCGQKNGDEA